LEEREISFEEAVTELLNADKTESYDDGIKEAWTKLGFDEFLLLFKHAIPQNYPQRYVKSKDELFRELTKVYDPSSKFKFSTFSASFKSTMTLTASNMNQTPQISLDDGLMFPILN